MRLARRALLGLAILATLTFIAVLVENYRAEKAWHECVAERAAAGEVLQQLPGPSTLEPARNFMKAPMLDKWLWADRERPETKAFAKIFPLSPLGKSGFDFRRGESFSARKFCELNTGVLFPAPGPNDLASTADVRGALRPIEGTLGELRSAVHHRQDSELVRPAQLSSVQPFDSPIVGFSSVRALLSGLVVDSCVNLAEGRTDLAVDDMLASLRLSRGICSAPDPLLIDAMIGVVGTRMALQPVWEGTRAHRLNDAQLQTLQGELQSIDVIRGLARSLRTERASALCTVDSVSAGDLLFQQFGKKRHWWHWTNFVWFPRGVILQNKVTFVQWSQPMLDLMPQVRSDGFLKARTLALDTEGMQEKSSPFSPYTLVARMALPSYKNVLEATVSAQAYVDMALIACALERHRLAHGAYPSSLASLVPAYLHAVPTDISNGQSLKYALTEGGSYQLYSVGLDGIDDKGAVDSKETDKGDWAWAQPAVVDAKAHDSVTADKTAPATLADGLYAILTTPRGEMTARLDYKAAPLTVCHFVGFAEGTLTAAKGQPYYDGLKFHRVVPGFVIQGGDPLGTGEGGPGYAWPDEFVPGQRHDAAGVLSMANAGPDTNGSQFFITLGEVSRLNYLHSVFGRVVDGTLVPARIQKDDTMSVRIVRVGEEAKAFRCDQAAFDVLRAKAKPFAGKATPGADSLFDDPSSLLQQEPPRAAAFATKLANFERATGIRVAAVLSQGLPSGFPEDERNWQPALESLARARGIKDKGAFLLRIEKLDKWLLFTPGLPVEKRKVIERSAPTRFINNLARAAQVQPLPSPLPAEVRLKLETDAWIDELLLALEPKS